MNKSIFVLLGLMLSCSNDTEKNIEISVSDFIATIDENPSDGQSIGTIDATTNHGSVSFLIVEQIPNGAFEVDSSTGELIVSDVNIFDFERNPKITGVIKVINRDVFENVAVTLNLININEIIIFSSDFTTTIDENPSYGQPIGTIDATTNQDSVSFSITEQIPSGAFAVDTLTGELTVVNTNIFDFETNSQITGVIKATNGDIFENIAVTINLNDIFELIPHEVVAGIGIAGYSGDGASAINAELNFPRHLVFDEVGNLYFADQNNNVIRKIDLNGVISTTAGNGIFGYSGDGALASSAQLNNPIGLSIDVNGNILIADSGNNVIRKIGVNGVITTIAGTGSPGFSGDNGLAIFSQLNNPRGVRIDNLGNIYIADTDNHRVRKIDINGIISTIAGNGTNGTSGDGGLATDASFKAPYDVIIKDNKIFIADITDGKIRKINSSGIISTIINDDRFHIINSPTALNFDNNDNLYVSDLSGVIFKIDPLGNTTVAFDNEIDYAGGIAFDSAFNLFYSDTFINQIKKIDNSNLSN